MTKTLNIIFGVFLAIGLAFSGVSLWAVHNTQSFVARAATAQGVVTGLDHRRDNSGSGGVYYHIVKFTTATGEAHTLYSNILRPA